MKRFISFLFVVLLAGNMMAVVPTESDLTTAGYNTKDNVVLCVKFIGDATVCNNVYFVGTFSGWAESFSGCPKFEPLSGFEGWYVAQAPYTSGFQGKPVQAADASDTFSWDYQPGTPDAWCHADGKYANIYDHTEKPGESEVTFPSAGAYIYTISFWKNHATPCPSQTRTINCDRAYWYKWGPSGDWNIYLISEDYLLYFGVPGTTGSPFGKFSSMDNTITGYSLSNYPCWSTLTSLQQADATVGISGTYQIVASAKLKANHDDEYNVNLSMPYPTAQTKTTIKGAVEYKSKETYYDSHYYEYELYVSNIGYVYIYTFGDNNTGSFTVNNNAVVYIGDNTNGETYAISGSYTVSEDSEGNVTISGTVLGANNVEYTLDIKNQNPKNLTATQNSDNTVTLAWDADPDVYYYVIDVYAENGSWLQGWYIYTNEEEPVEDRYSRLFTKISDNGTFRFRVQAYDSDYNSLGYANKEFEVKGIPVMGTATFNVLIPSDCCFDVSKGVWFRVDMAGTVSWMQADDAGGRWFSKSFDVTSVSYKVRVFNENNPSDWNVYSYETTVVNKETYYYLRKDSYNYNYDAWYLYEGNSSMKDHNYIPTDGSVTVDGSNGTFTINLSYTDKAYRYSVYLYYEGSTDYVSYSIYPNEEDLTSLSRTYGSSFPADQAFDRMEVWAYDNNSERPCETYVNNTPFTIPASEYVPKNLQADVHSDHTATLSWEANTKVKYYWVYVDYGGSTVSDYYYYTGDHEPVEGRYSVEFTDAVANGNYTFSVHAYDENNNYVGGTAKDFTIDGLAALGSSTVRVLIPSGTNFDVSKGVWFWWWQPGEEGQWIQAEDKGGRWYEATISGITSAAFRFQVHSTGKWSGSYDASYVSRYITESSVCMALNPYFDLIDADCSAVDYNYTITSVDVDAEPGKATFTIHASDYASIYAVYYRLHDSGNDYDWMGEGSLNENHALSLNPNNREAGVYDYRIYVYDEYGSSAASAYEGTMTLPANTFIPANLTVSPAGGNTYEISWDVATGVDRYFVDCRDNYDNLMLYGYFTPDELTVVGGKYVLKTGTALVSGMGYCHVEGYAANETYRRGSSILYFDITLVNLGAVTVRVLIPSDNNMDISNGVWIGWRHAGMDMDHYEYAQATEKSDRWFEASFTVPAISYQFFVLNESTSGANTQATTLATSYEAQSCYEMLFSMNGSFWKLPDADCNAPDHDYRIKNVKTESAGGEVTFTVEAKDYAKYYYVYARKKGTDDEFENVGYCESDGKSAVIEATFFINEDTEYDYKIYVTNTDRYNCVTEVYEGVVTVTKNPSAPADLKATVAPDGQTVIFSWTQDSQSKAAYYYILVVDEAIGSVRAEIPYIEGTTASTKLYISSDYYWYIYALDKDYNVLGLVQSSEYFKITAGKDLRPTNLKAVVNDQTVTLSWETEPEITQCKYYLYCTTEGRDFHALATSTNGKYSVTFTPPVGIYGNYEWSVAAATEDSYYTISQWVDGTDFTIEAPATPVTETYSIELYSVGGGSVNDIDGDYPKGTQLDIIAKPYDDYTFKEWSDGSKEAIRTITLTQDTVLTAYFVSAYINYTLTVTADEGGTVNDVSGTYPAATLIELVATPNSGYKFKEWSDGSTDAERTIWLYSDTDLVAIFEKDGGVTQLDEIRSQESGIRKVLINGQIYILRDDKIYTVQGQLVK